MAATVDATVAVVTAGTDGPTVGVTVGTGGGSPRLQIPATSAANAIAATTIAATVRRSIGGGVNFTCRVAASP
jgi:hypothetical protein